jgi:hypothetical protein
VNAVENKAAWGRMPNKDFLSQWQVQASGIHMAATWQVRDAEFVHS